MKEFKYVRISYLYKKDFEETVWCVDEEAFYKYLDFMNSTHRHSKFLSHYSDEFYEPINEALIKNYEEACLRFKGEGGEDED